MEDIESQLKSIFNVTKLQRNKKLFWYMKKVYVDDVKKDISFSSINNKKEDRCEIINFHDDDSLIFYRCFSYFKTESIALRKIYGDGGYCFQYDDNILKKDTEIVQIQIKTGNKHFFIENVPNLISTPFCFVIYKDDEKKTLLRATHKVSSIDNDKFNEILKSENYVFKEIGYSFEYEIRMFVKINIKILEQKLKDLNQLETFNKALKEGNMYLILKYKNDVAQKIIVSPFKEYEEILKNCKTDKSYYLDKVDRSIEHEKNI